MAGARPATPMNVSTPVDAFFQFSRAVPPSFFIMAFSVKSKKSGKTYFLHSRDQELKGGHIQTLYFFAADEREGSLDAVPAGYLVHENQKTGLPLLKKG